MQLITTGLYLTKQKIEILPCIYETSQGNERWYTS